MLYKSYKTDRYSTSQVSFNGDYTADATFEGQIYNIISSE